MRKTIPVREHSRRNGSHVRKHYRNLYVDKDFSTTASHKGDKLDGRDRVSKGSDLTAPIRAPDGTIVGRASLKNKSVKTTKTVYGNLPVREVGI